MWASDLYDRAPAPTTLPVFTALSPFHLPPACDCGTPVRKNFDAPISCRPVPARPLLAPLSPSAALFPSRRRALPRGLGHPQPPTKLRKLADADADNETDTDGHSSISVNRRYIK